MQQGDIVACDNCNRARPIQTAVIELFGDQIGFGPAGETDMYVESDDAIHCYYCLDDEYADDITENATHV